jgi:hypothetical protein
MILLLDLDGTLIDDRGYRAAIDATISRYSRAHGLPDWPPTDEEVGVLHAHGFSNEWDSVAFLLGAVHVETARAAGDGRPPRRPDYQAWTRRTAGRAGLPNERAREALLDQAPPGQRETIHALLDHVTDVRRSEVTRTFAEHILGSRAFSRHYGLPAALNCESFLETRDQPLIDEAGRRAIRACRSCIYTARPSLAPDGAPPVHPPEAEIGLALLGLQDLPLMALGQMQWLADQHGERVYDLTKPAPAQAAAAMLAACGVPAGEALPAAYALCREARLPDAFRRLDGQRVRVVEDNAGGVRACLAAAGLLASHGVRIEARGLGVAASAAKRDALARVCERVFEDARGALASIADDTRATGAGQSA